MDNKTMFKISYGLYVLTARVEGKDNGCIINTLLQATSVPNKVTITVNKLNLTHDYILNNKMFNVSMLDTRATMDIFLRFGFKSGKNVDKYLDFDGYARSLNGLTFINGCSNGYLSCYVTDTLDLGSHTMFIATVVDGEILSGAESLTYSYYQKHIKPATVKVESGYICSVCGYLFTAKELPPDFICPTCKHTAMDFVKV